MWRRALPILLLLGFVVWVPDSVRAHGVAVQSEPSAGAVLRESPPKVAIWFTEPVAAEFAAIRIRAARGGAVETTTGRVNPDNDRLFEVEPAQPLEHGTYIVTWRFFSQVDGHLSVGSFPFGVGAMPSVWDAPISVETPGVAETVARWLALAGAAVVTGTMIALLRCRPRASVARRLRRVVRAAALFLLVGAAAEIFLRLLQATNGAIDRQFLRALPASLAGALLLARVVLALVILRLALSWQPRALAATGALFLLASAVAGHAAVAPLAPLALPAQVAHEVAAAIWIGGLVYLVVLRLGREPDGAEQLGSAVARLSPLFAASVVALLATGALNAWLQVGSMERLLGTAYGGVLLQKGAIVGLMLALGAANVFLTRGRRIPRAAFRGVVVAEAAAGLVVLLLAGRLAQAQPARESQVVTGPLNRAPEREQAADGVVVGLIRDAPTDGALELALRPALGVGPVDAQRVSVRLSGPDGAGAQQTLVAQPLQGGRFWVNAAGIGAPGPLQVDVGVSSGPAEARTLFRLPLTQPDVATDAGDLQALLTKALQRMRAVHSVRVREQVSDTLQAAIARDVTWAEYQAPDRARYWIEDGPAGVVIGPSEYVNPGGGWRQLSRIHVFRLPAHFDYLSWAMDAKPAGQEVTGGEPTRLVNLFDPRRSVIVTVWIAADGRVLHELTDESESKGSGYGGDFVTRDFYDFDAVPPIEAPVSP